MSVHEMKLTALNRRIIQGGSIDAGGCIQGIFAKRAMLLKLHPELEPHWNCA